MKNTLRNHKKNKKSNSSSSRKNRGGASDLDISLYYYQNPLISNQPNIDPNYVESGIIHVTESQGINALRTGATDLANFFGAKGFDNTIIDKTRNIALEKLFRVAKQSNIDKISNLRMEMTNSDPGLIVVNLYGTALKKIK
jgi:uncharacterized protein YbjQ (UPF0145 family)